MHLDVTMDGSGIDVNVQGVGYTSQQVVNAIDGASISPGELSVGNDGPITSFDDISLLSAVGYGSGSVLPILTANPVGKSEASTTATAYQFNDEWISLRFPYGKLFSLDATVVFGVAARVEGNGAIRLYNATKSETVLEDTSPSKNVFIGYTEYTASDPSNSSLYRLQFKSHDGSEDVFSDPFIVGGIQL